MFFKNYKLFIVILAVLLCVYCLCVSPIAHSGRTDGKGGHHNKSDGSYHYHHGYSAHDHYDMDGDGKNDCPYDFKDKTDYNSDESVSSSTKQRLNNKLSFWDVIGRIFLIVMLSILIMVSGIGGLVYYAFESLINFVSEKIFKVTLKESVVSCASIAFAFVTALVIVALMFLKADGVL